MRLSWLVLVLAAVLPVAAVEVATPPVAASAPAPVATPAPAAVPAATVSAPTYKLWTLRNDVIEVVVSERQGAIHSISLLHEQPIRLRDWQVRELQKQHVVLPEPDKPLSVLDAFNPSTNDEAARHNWFDGVELPVISPTPWMASQSDALHLRLEYADPVKGLRWTLSYELVAGKHDLISTLAVENGGGRELVLKPKLYPLNGVRQDDPSADAAYVTVSYHAGGVNGQITNLGMPGPRTSVPVPTANLDYVALKSRFFAALWTPLSFSINGKTTPGTATQAPAQPIRESGPGGSVGPAVSAANAAGSPNVLWLSADGYTQTQGAAHQAYITAQYLGANNEAIRLASGQVMNISWKTTVSSMRKVDLARLTEVESAVQYTDWYYRFFKSLAKLTTWLLNAVVWAVINYGVAVVVLTFLLKAALHRTTFKQYESMMKMQKLAPDLKLIQEQYKNDKQKQFQKQSELWKKHNVSPFSGCLPVLIQIPVFTALYMTFSYSADMRGHGFLWVNDLTLPDQLYGWMIGSFPLTINPLPLIYIAVTVWMSLTQKMPSGGDPQQEQMMKMMRWMPVIFGVIFYQMPAGLVLYFTVNAVLSTIEIKMVKKKLGMT